MLAEQGELHIPRELLRRRSPYLQRTIDEQPYGELHASVILHGVDLRTLTNFYRWSLMEEPFILDGIEQEELEKLGIFAEAYQVFALEHQVADKFDNRFNHNSASNKWGVQPDMASRVYQKCGPASCLRLVFQAALKLVTPEQLQNEWVHWSKVAEVGGDLGRDLLKAIAETQVTQRPNPLWGSRLPRCGNPCQFHDHERQELSAEIEKEMRGFGSKMQCPFRVIECFPVEMKNEADQSSGKVKKKKGKKEKKQALLLEESRPDEAPREIIPEPGYDELAAAEAEAEAEPIYDRLEEAEEEPKLVLDGPISAEEEQAKCETED